MSIPAILIATVIGTGIGIWWYSDSLFGKTLPKNIHQKNKSIYLFIFLNTLLTAIVLGQFIRAFNTDPNILQGMLLGGMAGLGLITPAVATNFLLERKTMSHLVVTVLHHTLVTIVMGGILAAFS